MSDSIRLLDTDLRTSLGMDIEIVGLLIDVEDAETKKHDPYLKITISDKDATLTASIWDLNLVHVPTIKASLNQVVKVTGRPKTFGNGIAFSVFKVDALTEADLTTYGWTKNSFYNVIENRQELVDKLNAYLNEISNTIYGKIAGRAIQNCWDTFKNVAAGKSMHHSAAGGLLWHTVEVMQIVDTFYNISRELGYAELCRPLLLAGAAIHDIGKCKELSTTPTGSTEYTANSVLESHHMTGIAMITEAATQLGYENSNEISERRHIIAAHHEQKDWGQIKDAAMIEAVLVSKADYISALLNATSRNLNRAKPGEQYTAFGYNRSWVKSMGSFNNDMTI